MVAAQAPTATYGLALRGRSSAVAIRLALAALAALALAISGVVLALSLPHSNAPSQTSFLGPTATAPNH